MGKYKCKIRKVVRQSTVHVCVNVVNLLCYSCEAALGCDTFRESPRDSSQSPDRPWLFHSVCSGFCPCWRLCPARRRTQSIGPLLRQKSKVKWYIRVEKFWSDLHHFKPESDQEWPAHFRPCPRRRRRRASHTAGTSATDRSSEFHSCWTCRFEMNKILNYCWPRLRTRTDQSPQSDIQHGSGCWSPETSAQWSAAVYQVTGWEKRRKGKEISSVISFSFSFQSLPPEGPEICNQISSCSDSRSQLT